MLQDTEGVIRSRNSNNKQCNCQWKKNGKMTNNDIKTLHRKIHIELYKNHWNWGLTQVLRKCKKWFLLYQCHASGYSCYIPTQWWKYVWFLDHPTEDFPIKPQMVDHFNCRLNTTVRKVFPKPTCQAHVNVRYLCIVELVYKNLSK